ncbi:MAG: DNA helicase II [Legionellaceae bacterium]|nr:DNA helicase II [Legionellaceae bacterium]
MRLPEILEGLNERQQAAVTAPLQNMLVLAGAGSGKTRVLVSRIAWLIAEQQFSPLSILAVTFTNKAAGEMKSRLSAMLQIPVAGLWVGTFHGLCHRLLRRHYESAGLPEQFHILDSDDQARLIKKTIAAMNLDVEQWPVKKAQYYINQKKDEGLRPGHIQPLHYGPEKTWLAIYAGYEQACHIAGVIDFAEILLRAHELLRDNPDILDHYRRRFQVILVDEFQDTNTIQYAWIRLLAGENGKVMAVGDDDQSIYGWRGAKVENLQRFNDDFSEPVLIRLEQNYRSTETILQASNALIAHNDQRMGKELWTEGGGGEKIVLYSAFNEIEEALFVAQRIEAEMAGGTSADAIAILYRSNAQSRVMEEALLRIGISYRIHGGLRYFERAEIKDAMAYLRLLANADDDTAFERVVNFPTRGIGEKTLESLRELARQESCSLWQSAQQHLAQELLPARAANALEGFLRLVDSLRAELADEELDIMVSEINLKSGLQAHFAKLKGDKGESKLDNLQELVSAAKQFRYDYNDGEEEMPILNAFLAHASLEAGEMQADAQQPSVNLMTLHAAKGLEFPVVFMVGMEEGVFPSKLSIEESGRLEEERRLCYVGMTRAMKKLYMSYAEIRRQYGREEYHRPSRFLREIPAEFLEAVRVQQAAYTPKQASFRAPVQTQSDCGYYLGQTVQHAKFGQGTILSMEGSGAHTRVEVKFVDNGSKWLVLAYANLTEA